MRKYGVKQRMLGFIPVGLFLVGYPLFLVYTSQLIDAKLNLPKLTAELLRNLQKPNDTGSRLLLGHKHLYNLAVFSTVNFSVPAALNGLHKACRREGAGSEVWRKNAGKMFLFWSMPEESLRKECI